MELQLDGLNCRRKAKPSKDDDFVPRAKRIGWANAGNPQPKYLSSNSCFFMQEPRCKVLKPPAEATKVNQIA